MTFPGRCGSDHTTRAGASSAPVLLNLHAAVAAGPLGMDPRRCLVRARGRGRGPPVCNAPEAAHVRVLSESPGMLGPSGELGRPCPAHHHGLQLNVTRGNRGAESRKRAAASPRPAAPPPTMVWGVGGGQCSRLYKHSAPGRGGCGFLRRRPVLRVFPL